MKKLGLFRYPIDEIREKCDLVEIISQHVALRKSGRRLTGLCPFHNEKTPSFYVDPERQTWKCFGCGEGGDVFSFVRRIDALTFPEAVEQLARKVGVHIERSEQAAKQYSERERILRANNLACAFFREMLRKSQKAQDYLARRGLTEASIEKYKIGYAPASWDQLLSHLVAQRVSQADAMKAGLIVPRQSSQGFYDRFRDRVIFPILDTSDRVIGFGGRAFDDEQPKYLNSPETPLFNKSKTLYGLNFARKMAAQEDRLIIVEGYMDVIAAQEAGFENAVATLGTALTEDHAKVISRFAKNVVLAFDADSAGMAAALRSWPIFERSGLNVRILSMPKGEDPDSLLRSGDRSRFASLLDKALPVVDYRVKLTLLKHDLKTDAGKTAALQDAVKVLAEVDSAVERERLIRLLAKYHPNFSTGTTLAEEHLRSEINRWRSRGRRSSSVAQRQADNERAQEKGEKLNLIQRSERLLLGMIILRDVQANKVFEALPPNEFTEENTRTLAASLRNQYAELGRIDMNRLRSELTNTPAEELLTDILVGLEDSELNHQIDDLVQVIINHKRSEQRQRMRHLASKIDEGLVKPGDEEYEEYLRLVKETANPWGR